MITSKPEDIRLSIIGVDDPILSNDIINRFNVILTTSDKLYLPKDAVTNTSGYEDDDVIHTYISQVNDNIKLHLNTIQHLELKLCNKTYNDCMRIIDIIMSDPYTHIPEIYNVDFNTNEHIVLHEYTTS